MPVLTFHELAYWKGGKETIDVLLRWCNEHCEGRVNHITIPESKKRAGESQAMAFDLESDLLLFTLAWK